MYHHTVVAAFYLSTNTKRKRNENSINGLFETRFDVFQNILT